MFEGVSVAWEKRPKSDPTRGAADVGAYEVCDVSRGGRLESSPESDMLSEMMLMCIGSMTACFNGLKVDRLEPSAGRERESCWCAPGVWLGSLPVGVCPSPPCSSTTSRMRPSTRRTMLPTTTSRGCAEVSRLPTWRMRSTSLAASRPLNSPTTRRSRAVVAMAHGLELRICRRFSSLLFVSVAQGGLV